MVLSPFVGAQSVLFSQQPHIAVGNFKPRFASIINGYQRLPGAEGILKAFPAWGNF